MSIIIGVMVVVFNIFAVSVIGGGNASTLSKPPTRRKSLTNLIR